MSLVNFEVKKSIKEKKIIWILLIVLLATSGMYIQNRSADSSLKEDTVQKLEKYLAEIGRIQRIYQEEREHSQLNETQAKQYELLQQTQFAGIRWRSAIDKGQLDEALHQESEFYLSLQEFEELGGQPFTSLQGMDREIAIAKNTWLHDHGLLHEDENNPISPHLFLKDIASFFFSIVGILILVLFFGNILIEEKDENTWSTLKTQPLTNKKIILSKYLTLIFALLTFIVLVIGIGSLIPIQFGEHLPSFQYPQIIVQEETFEIIPTSEFILKNTVLFLSVALVMLSLTLLLNKIGKNTFTVLLISVVAIILGYLLTDNKELLQSSYNPFTTLIVLKNLEGASLESLRNIPIKNLLWSIALIIITNKLPDKEINFISNRSSRKPFKQGQIVNSTLLLNLSRFEWRKLLRQSLFAKTCFLLVLVTLSFYMIITGETQKNEVEYLNILEERYARTQDFYLPNLDSGLEINLSNIKGLDNEDEIKQYYLEQYEKAKVFLKEKLMRTERAIEAFKQENWAALYDYQLFYNQYRKGIFETGRHIAIVGGLNDDRWEPFIIDISLAEKEWLVEHEIQPIFPGEFVLTVFEKENEPWIEVHEKIDNSGLYSLHLYFEKYIYLIPLVLFIFLLGGGLADEMGKKKTYNLLVAQPLSSIDIFKAKLLNAKIVTIVSCLGLCLLLLLMGTAYNRFGDWRYPILHYDATSTVLSSEYTGAHSVIRGLRAGFHFIPLGHYLLQALALFTSITIFFMSLSILLSIFFKRTMGVLASTILIGISGYWLSEQYLTETAHLSPFTYLNIPKILNGEIGMYLNNPSVNFLTGSIINLLLALILVVIGLILLSKKDSASSLGRKWLKSVTVKKIQNNAG